MTTTMLESLHSATDTITPPPSGPAGWPYSALVPVMWGCIIASIVGIMICGSMLAYERITGAGDPNAKLVGGLVGAPIIGSAAGLIKNVVPS